LFSKTIKAAKEAIFFAGLPLVEAKHVAKILLVREQALEASWKTLLLKSSCHISFTQVFVSALNCMHSGSNYVDL